MALHWVGRAALGARSEQPAHGVIRFEWRRPFGAPGLRARARDALSLDIRGPTLEEQRSCRTEASEMRQASRCTGMEGIRNRFGAEETARSAELYRSSQDPCGHRPRWGVAAEDEDQIAARAKDAR